MANVLFLAPGELPPVGEKSVLVECVPGYDWTNTSTHDSGVTHQIGPDDLALMLPLFEERANRDGHPTIYVVGALLPGGSIVE